MRLGRIGALCALLSCMGAASASAQSPQVREGFWFGVDLGYGLADTGCDGCDLGGSDWGAGLHIRMGWALNQKVLLGAELAAWNEDQDGVEVFLYDILGTATFYPGADSGFFVKAGVGGGFVDTQASIDDTEFFNTLGKGLGLMAGVGYDIRVWGNVSVTPGVTFWTGRSMDLALDGAVFEDWRHNVVNFTLGVTFH